MLVLFDIDDTLIDHTSAVATGVASLFAELQSPLALGDFHQSWITAMREHFPRYLRGELSYEEQRRARLRQTVDPHLTDSQADELFARYFQVYEAAWSPFPDVVPCLATLTPHALGIISNGNGVEQRSKLLRTGLAAHFPHVFISDDHGHAKPDAELFRLACRAAGCAVRDAVYVGDLYDTDAVGARAAGLAGVWLDRQLARRSDHAPPIIHDLGELPTVLHSRAV
jgi:putative hydrolase of the HAD superfamily